MKSFSVAIVTTLLMATAPFVVASSSSSPDSVSEINMMDDQGSTAFHKAMGDPVKVKEMLAKGADVFIYLEKDETGQDGKVWKWVGGDALGSAVCHTTALETVPMILAKMKEMFAEGTATKAAILRSINAALTHCEANKNAYYNRQNPDKYLLVCDLLTDAYGGYSAVK
ncbi:hypothetical protein [Candidatus Finniella inopinata]|uniref:Ankyrin repeat domain-containing protein n=1 Tax=Candidatus Finniella inopinata TaxID=1696036 RepID=A0A4Q7DJ69_9PROT|nr:hypothetical protein [Candidatus Finniella inopinata]RZI46893.1 hypothetical protein EQU50_01325 [Candidatus Finniella inopinata]